MPSRWVKLRPWCYTERDAPTRAAEREHAVERDLAADEYYPSGYSPVTLLSTQPDGPDPTGPVVDYERLDG